MISESSWPLPGESPEVREVEALCVSIARKWPIGGADGVWRFVRESKEFRLLERCIAKLPCNLKPRESHPLALAAWALNKGLALGAQHLRIRRQ